VACSIDDANASLKTRLGAAQARWTAAAIDDYRFTLAYHCFCMFRDPVEITIVDGQIASVTANGANADMSVVGWYPLRVEAAFRAVAENLDADEIEVAFDPVLGYPTSVTANPDQDMFDEEFSFEITNLVAGS
jgi:hypothetical protein